MGRLYVANQVVAGGFGVAGFQAIDARVTKQQQVAVARIGRWRRRGRGIHERVKAHMLRKISQQTGGKQGHVARAVVTWPGAVSPSGLR